MVGVRLNDPPLGIEFSQLILGLTVALTSESGQLHDGEVTISIRDGLFCRVEICTGRECDQQGCSDGEEGSVEFVHGGRLYD